jgi:hypothetical protein
MKRLHVHVSVDDIEKSVAFYSVLFATEPTVIENDYAKWMLDDPRVNFAISKRGDVSGVQHLGIQVESAEELAEVYDRLKRAERPVVEEKATTCCYAHSDKQWIADPQGIAWETFLTHGSATVYGESAALGELKQASGNICCEPKLNTKPEAAKAGCCAA